MLWKSYEKSGNGGKREGSPRKRAATAVGLSEGSLVSFRYVLDSGFDDIIADLLTEKSNIDTAYRLAKSKVDGKKQSEVRRSRMVRVEQTLDSLKQYTDTLGGGSKLSEQLIANVSAAINGKGAKNDQERLRKKLAAARLALEKVQADGGLTRLVEVIVKIEAELK